MIRTLFRLHSRAVAVLTAGAATLLLAGCGPEAPPCNDPETTQSVLSIVRQAHDDHLRGLPYASTDLATFELAAVAPTAYDDTLKLRSCKAVFVTTLRAQAAEASTKYVQAMSNPMLDLFKPLQDLGAVLGSPSQPVLPEDAKRDILQLQILNPGPVRADPIRKSITYQIQKQEGGKEFMVSTNVDVSQTIPYLRVASRAQKAVEEEVVKDSKRTAEKAQQEAEIDRLSASGTWRKTVYIKGLGEPNDPAGRCYERGLYCFQGFDGSNQFESSYYQLDAKKLNERSRDAMKVAYRDRRPVCLINVRRGTSPDIFTAEGFSTFLNDKGDAVDCLPSAEKESWAQTLEKGKAGEIANQAPAQTLAAAPTPPTATTMPSPAASGPQNLTAAITRYERCGEEAVCLHTARGNTIYMQASQMRHVDYAMLETAIKNRSTLCLKEVARTEGKSFTAEAMDIRC